MPHHLDLHFTWIPISGKAAPEAGIGNPASLTPLFSPAPTVVIRGSRGRPRPEVMAHECNRHEADCWGIKFPLGLDGSMRIARWEQSFTVRMGSRRRELMIATHILFAMRSYFANKRPAVKAAKATRDSDVGPAMHERR